MAQFHLNKLSSPLRRRGPVINIILDGIALTKNTVGNAYKLARTPCLDYLWENFQHRSLYAHGYHVGMPDELDIGNSEVGHNAIGAGRIFAQGARLVQEAIKDGSLYRGEAWQRIVSLTKNSKRALHLLGLLSDGNVHSHISHIKSLVTQAAQDGIKKIYLHLLTDGRDTAPTSSLQLLQELETKLASLRDSFVDLDCRIVSIAGRMVAFMDRYEANWGMVERGWQLTVEGKGRQFPSAEIGIRTLHQETPNDQFIAPFLVIDKHARVPAHVDASQAVTIGAEDVVVCFNFRGDRAIELSRAFTGKTPIKKEKDITTHYFGMTLYDGDTHTPAHYLVPPPAITATMGEYLVHTGVRLFAVSETQKYGHVTYFWNGNRSQPFDKNLETYLEIKGIERPLEDIPWMKAAEISDACIAYLKSGRYGFGRVNFPNGDMVGHTGHFAAAVIAVEAVDLALSRLLAAVKAVEGIAIVTADHGNCEEMYFLDPQTGQPQKNEAGTPLVKTAHTTHPVPFIIYDPAFQGEYTLRSDAAVAEAGIAHIAATTLMLMGFEPPAHYLPSLIAFNA